MRTRKMILVQFENPALQHYAPIIEKAFSERINEGWMAVSQRDDYLAALRSIEKHTSCPYAKRTARLAIKRGVASNPKTEVSNIAP